MKILIAALVLLTGTTFFVSCGPTADQAISYNDAIIDEQIAIIDNITAVFESFKDVDHPDKMDIAYTEAVKQCETGTEVVSKMEGFDGSTAFRDEALSLFKVYKSVLDNELKQMIIIYNLPQEEYTPEKEEEWSTLYDAAFLKMDPGLEKLKAAQEEFGKKYNVEVETD